MYNVRKGIPKLQDYIRVIPNVLDKQFCDGIINNKKYEYTPSTVQQTDMSSSLDTEVRDCLETSCISGCRKLAS